MTNPFEVLVELTRGPLVESVHFGAFAVVDSSGKLLASGGDVRLIANLRSSAKPFQALPFIERGGAEYFGLSEREVAISCASHLGTDEHADVLRGYQQKIGVRETDLQCGVHEAIDEATAEAMRARGETPTPNRHNCSGKHTGMLAHARMRDLPIENYLALDHEVQKTILRTFAEMTDLAPEEVLIGIDGCSAPTFAAPMYHAALAFARLSDPRDLAPARAEALRHIFSAMTNNPVMVSGPGGFDTVLMQACGGKVVVKGGAEGYQALGIAPGVIGERGVGITVKIADGDPSSRARALVMVELLRQLGALTPAEETALAAYATRPIYNWRKLEVGVIRPVFDIRAAQQA